MTEPECTHNYGALGVGCMPGCKKRVSQPSIRKQFEEARTAYLDSQPYATVEGTALWAAKWMAERLSWEILDSKDVTYASTKIRQLAKELES